MQGALLLLKVIQQNHNNVIVINPVDATFPFMYHPKTDFSRVDKGNIELK